MKKLLLILPLFAILISCKNENTFSDTEKLENAKRQAVEIMIPPDDHTLILKYSELEQANILFEKLPTYLSDMLTIDSVFEEIWEAEKRIAKGNYDCSDIESDGNLVTCDCFIENRNNVKEHHLGEIDSLRYKYTYNNYKLICEYIDKNESIYQRYIFYFNNKIELIDYQRLLLDQIE